MSASAKIIQVSLVMKRKRVADRIQNLFHNLQHIASRTKHEQFDEMVVKCCVFYRLWFLCDVILLIYLRSSSSADRLDSRLEAAGAGNVPSGVLSFWCSRGLRLGLLAAGVEGDREAVLQQEGQYLGRTRG